MDDQACPRCKTTKYRNPSLKLMVNVCGHALCESCVDMLFLKGKYSTDTFELSQSYHGIYFISNLESVFRNSAFK